MHSEKDSLSTCKAADMTIKISFVTRLIRNGHLSMTCRAAARFVRGLDCVRARCDRYDRAQGTLRPELS